MSVEAIMQAIAELGSDDRDRVLEFIEGMYEEPVFDKEEANRLVRLADNTKRWYTEEEVEHLFASEDED